MSSEVGDGSGRAAGRSRGRARGIAEPSENSSSTSNNLGRGRGPSSGDTPEGVGRGIRRGMERGRATITEEEEIDARLRNIKLNIQSARDGNYILPTRIGPAPDQVLYSAFKIASDW